MVLLVSVVNSASSSTLKLPIVKAAGVEKGRKGPDHGGNSKDVIGRVKREDVKKIAEYKRPDLNVDSLEAAERCVEGSARSMGIAIVD